MARGATLGSILNDVRVEAKLSTSAALNVQDRERQVYLIQREQERLWEETDWPHLRVERFIPLQIGQRFYDMSACLNEAGATKGDLAFDRIEMVEVKDGGEWRPLRYDIDRRQYAAHDSALDERASPALTWRIYEDEQIEIWPIPDTAAVSATQEGYLRITGIRQLATLVDDDDRADIDDRLISLYVAARLLASQKSPETELVLATAKRLKGRLTGNLKKSPGFQMFGVGERRPARTNTRFITKYNPPE